MKKFIPLLLFSVLASCSKTPGDHDVRVAAKNFIRQQLAAPSTAKFAPDNEIHIIKEKGDSTFRISIYEDSQNEYKVVTGKEWNLHLLYTGGGVSDIKNWKVLND